MEYKVYVKLNENGYIIAINSSEFLSDITNWIEIDSGYGDKYHHAQGNYFSKSIYTDSGVYRYKMVNGKIIECTVEEIEEQENANKPESPELTQEERIAELEVQNAILMECVLEMSEMVYA